MSKQDLAMQVLQQVVKLPVVKVDRSKFLVDKFSKLLDPKDIPRLLEEGPTALLSQDILDKVADSCIKDNVLLASGTSVLAGIPGGLALAITIPTDVAQKALAKTLWYPILEKVLKIFGVNLTKGGFAKGMGKFIPILGGVVSGGLTYTTMKPMGKSLQRELSKLVNYSEAQYQRDVETIQKEAELIEAE